jgi:ribonuclease HI
MLVVRQVEGVWRVKQPHLRPLLDEVRRLLRAYDEVDIAHVPREQNTDADMLVNAALDAPEAPPDDRPGLRSDRG